MFERSKLDWTELRKDQHAGLLAWHRRLIALRRQIPALTDPRLDRIETEYDQQARWLIVRQGPVAVAANLGTRTWTFAADPSATLAEASDRSIKQMRKGLVLPPDTVAILTGQVCHDTCLGVDDPTSRHARPCSSRPARA